jgi:hypothetical protein
MTAGDGLLPGLLATAVPLEISRMRAMGEAERSALARECGQYLAEHGDDVLYRSRRKGGSAKAFAALARGAGRGGVPAGRGHVRRAALLHRPPGLPGGPARCGGGIVTAVT